MCVVSMIIDHYGDKWRDRYPDWQSPQPYTPTETPEKQRRRFMEFVERTKPVEVPAISQAEIEEFRQLLERAREYDKRNNEPECELDEKKEAVKQIAKQLGVEINFL
jgi:hypothetical protein